MNEESPDLTVAVFGREVELFFESDIGMYLSQCCQAEIDTATESLKRVKPTESDEIRELQNRIWRAESVMGWLSDAMRSGKQAAEALKL